MKGKTVLKVLNISKDFGQTHALKDVSVDIEQGEITLAQSECRLVRSVTEHILKTERVTLENIL